MQHPEFETFLGAGSPHGAQFTCADCHMPTVTAEDGSSYHSHALTNPLENKEMIEKTCALCHTDLEAEVRGVQAEIVKRTTTIGKQLAVLTDELAIAVESGKYTDDELAEVRQLARDAQFYWDFVFVENSEGVHNPALARDCLNRAESLGSQAALALVALCLP